MRLSAGVAVSRELVPDNAQARMWFCIPGEKSFEDIRYSVPPLAVWNTPAGDVAGWTETGGLLGWIEAGMRCTTGPGMPDSSPAFDVA